jgi:thiol:disulfide interchange protein DsbD
MKIDRRWGWEAFGWAAAFLAVAFLSLAVLPRAATATDPDPAGDVPTELNVPVSAFLSAEAMAPGGEAVLAVIYDVPPDAHIQVNEFLYTQPKEGEPFALGEPRRSATTLFEEEPVHAGRTIAWHKLRLAPDASPGARELHLLAGHQACIEKPVFACFAPVDVELRVQIEVVPAGSAPRASANPIFASAPADLPPAAGGAAAPAGMAAAGAAPKEAGAAESPGEPVAASSAAPPSGLAGRLEGALAARSLLAFLLVFIGGILTSFTPCVYPMIPITISFIGGQAKSRLGGFFLSLFFVLGIAIMYSVLGVVAASTGALFGSAMQSTPVLIAVSAVFFAMGASMLGVFDLTLPSSMQTKLQAGPRSGVIGAIFMGMVTGIVASPCVGPVLVVLLTEIAKMGSIVLGFLYLFTFALGLGLLFLVIGTFAGAIAALPQAGGWMDTVKHLFGVVLIAMGIFYLRNLIGPTWTSTLLGAFAVFVGTYAGAFHPVPEDPPPSRLFRKGLGIVLVLVGSFLMLNGLARQAGWTLPGTRALSASVGGVGEGRPGPRWVADDAAALAQARSEGKPAFIDFYADWCAACKELDHKTWPDAAVVAEAQRFVAIKLDFTRRDQANAAKQASYGVAGLPTVIFYDSSGREAARFFGFRPAREVLSLMQSVR